jgi:6-phosphogluconate dehydrogenase
VEIGLVGIGGMGLGMARRLAVSHQVVAFDLDSDARAAAAEAGMAAVESLDELVVRLTPPRAVLVMLPPGGPTRSGLHDLATLLAPDDSLVDGGNTHYDESITRGRALDALGIHFVDMGTSGGMGGSERGYSLMIGGSEAAVRRLSPAFEALTPDNGRAWAHLGPNGAGHFAKMVHNQVKRGMEQAYAEGLTALSQTPRFSFDLRTVTEVWGTAAIARSAILDLIHEALVANPDLGPLAAYVADSERARWTTSDAIDQMVQRGFDRDQLG